MKHLYEEFKNRADGPSDEVKDAITTAFRRSKAPTYLLWALKYLFTFDTDTISFDPFFSWMREQAEENNLPPSKYPKDDSNNRGANNLWKPGMRLGLLKVVNDVVWFDKNRIDTPATRDLVDLFWNLKLEGKYGLAHKSSKTEQRVREARESGNDHGIDYWIDENTAGDNKALELTTSQIMNLVGRKFEQVNRFELTTYRPKDGIDNEELMNWLDENNITMFVKYSPKGEANDSKLRYRLMFEKLVDGGLLGF